MDKEKWIEEILQSTKGIRPVSSDPYMATRIEAKLQKPVVSKLPMQWVYVSAAAMLLLLITNIMIMRRGVSTQAESSGVSQLMKEYGWSNENIYSADPSNRAHE
jgi:hypothetical protein